MTAEQQQLEVIVPGALRERVTSLQKQGYRLVQIGAARLGSELELTYSFDLEYRLVNLRLTVPAQGANLPSISGIFWCAFLYENEIHDLFQAAFEGLAVDFGGKLYQTRVKYPFASPAAAPAPTAKAPAAAAVPAQLAPQPAQPVPQPALAH